MDYLVVLRVPSLLSRVDDIEDNSKLRRGIPGRGVRGGAPVCVVVNGVRLFLSGSCCACTYNE